MAAGQTKCTMWTVMSAETSRIKAMPARKILLFRAPQQHSGSTQKQKKLNNGSSIIYEILLSAFTNLVFPHLVGNDRSLVAHFKEGFVAGDYSGRCSGIRERICPSSQPASQDNVNDVLWDPPLEGLLI